ncbi:metalloregulator ArsR/SmtB family transcription factor [Actinoplanes sp. NPDC048967]|uniref:ArsR/SmtB family transcription factor n=1 Tax=Actinoplanes sp. NPDC048967 TaxID=3155269 RepID=UPI0033C48DB8
MYARDNGATATDLQEPLTSDDVIQAATVTLGMLADGTRLRLMAALVDAESDVTALTRLVGAARPAVSQHLGKLRLAGLVRARRDGRRSVYAVTDPHVRRLVVEALRMAEHRFSDRPAHHASAPVSAPH